ncbi:hypothetical protein [Bradyrhizobium sp. 1(2017)]|uniref:hypothetical protein n=1 Tax=Bradyrhizobium sp. 1(2017) TaxID=1404888 RepID=UPI001FF01D4C|nr:hypothetical protein [Bradyrhizobium sp. 1(2017)]
MTGHEFLTIASRLKEQFYAAEEHTRLLGEEDKRCYAQTSLFGMASGAEFANAM